MKNILLLLAALTIISCSVDNSHTTMYNYTEDQIGVTGLVLEAPAAEMHITFAQVEQIYLDTEACMGITAAAPTVWFKDFINHVGIGGVWGVYLPLGELVMVNNNMPSPFERSEVTDYETLRHEYVHHILSQNGMNTESVTHDSPMFAQCGVGVNQYN